MLSAERRNLILSQIREKKKVFVNDLSRQFDVSEETIRRDLERLDEEGFVIKGYGGAVLNEEFGMDLPFNVRCRINPGAKDVIAQLSLCEITPGDHIFLDASSTSVFLSRALKKLQMERLTVVTNSVENAVTLSHISNAKVLLTGGELSQVSMSLSGAKTLDSISGYHMDKAFISCKGLDKEHGVTEGNDEVSLIKKAALNASDKVYLMADAEKFDKVNFSKVCGLERVDALITELRPKKSWITALSEKDIRLICPE